MADTMMGSGKAETLNRELGDFLRARRERLTPKAVGLPAGQRRRTAGLRREEVAELAGIGIDWYVRLEQGRNVRPSPAVVDALARALKLTKAEHSHLKALARPAPPGAFVREVVPDAVRRVVESLNQPAYVSGRRFDVLAWNTAADEIFGYSRVPEDERNTLLSLLTKPVTRKLFGAGWESEARRVLAQFRQVHDLWSHDPSFVDLRERLRAGCPEFDGWWKSHDVRAPVAGRKQLKHPKKGMLEFEYATFQANDDPGLKLAIFTPV